MASFIAVGDNLELAVLDKGESIDIAISGTYNMTILFQRETVTGGDAWETLLTFNTANATEAETYVTRQFGENLRLIVDVDTSGTATVTLTNAAAEGHSYLGIKDRVGTPLLDFDQGGLVLHLGERHADGGVVDVTGATVTLTAEAHAGRVVTLNRAAGVTVTLPASVGLGDVYRIFTGTTVTSNNNIVQAAFASDSFVGGVGLATDIAGVTILSNVADDTVTMNGTTTGGIAGSWLQFTDVAVGVFMVEGFLCASGVEADPFSAAV